MDLADLKISLQNTDAVVDALLGIGAEGAPRGIYKEIIDLINKSAAIKISIDVPSGFEVKADYTYACGFIKEGCAAGNCGKIKILDIGLPEELKNFK
jgi:NAD(P)H-hydrate epimerase